MTDWRFQFKRGTTEQWATSTVILKDGEPGLEDNSNDVPPSLKFGDGVHLWADLDYFIEGGGVPGPEGDSAYEVAVDNGFVGTEAEWLDSLVGATGATGATGPEGDQGPQGDQGPAGTAPTNVMLAYRWNGSAYIASTNAGHYVGPNDPGSVPDGSIWDQTP